MNERVFLDGTYHGSRARELEDMGRSLNAQSHLRYFYASARDRVKEYGWQYPLEQEKPKVLQMGIESSNTAFTFMNFVRGCTDAPEITVADMSPLPLEQCKRFRMDKDWGVTLVQADTTDLPFEDTSFDMIETDGLLQFLSREQKQQAISEWYRILKPGGILTTRDRFVGINEPAYTWDQLNRVREAFSQRLGVYTYPSTTEVMRYLLRSQGFEAHIEKDRVPQGSRLLIHEIVARKPLEEAR